MSAESVKFDVKNNLFWLRDHHMAVHEDVWYSFVDAGQNWRSCKAPNVNRKIDVEEYLPIVIFGTKWLQTR